MKNLFLVNQCDIYNNYSVIGTNKFFNTLIEAEKYAKKEYLKINGKNYFNITKI